MFLVAASLRESGPHPAVGKPTPKALHSEAQTSPRHGAPRSTMPHNMQRPSRNVTAKTSVDRGRITPCFGMCRGANPHATQNASMTPFT